MTQSVYRDRTLASRRLIVLFGLAVLLLLLLLLYAMACVVLYRAVHAHGAAAWIGDRSVKTAVFDPIVSG